MKLENIEFINILEKIAEGNKKVLSLACKQTSKFEGWLKFEIAKEIVKEGFELSLEKDRFDLAISDGKNGDFVVELKTAKIKSKGIKNKTRSATKDFKSIEGDIEKIKRSGKKGKVVFVIFPVPVNDERYLRFIERVQKNTGVSIIQNFQHIENNYGIVLCESEVINSKE